jgi:hypothetical protein
MEKRASSTNVSEENGYLPKETETRFMFVSL